MRAWRRFLALDARARRVALAVLALLPWVAGAVHLAGVSRARRLLARLPWGVVAAHGLTPAEAARLVFAASRLLRCGCLPRSLLLARIVEDSDSGAPVVRLGVARPKGGSFRAHAWVELDGVPLGEDANLLSGYVALPLDGRAPSAS